MMAPCIRCGARQTAASIINVKKKSYCGPCWEQVKKEALAKVEKKGKKK